MGAKCFQMDTTMNIKASLSFQQSLQTNQKCHIFTMLFSFDWQSWVNVFFCFADESAVLGKIHSQAHCTVKEIWSERTLVQGTLVMHMLYQSEWDLMYAWTFPISRFLKPQWFLKTFTTPLLYPAAVWFIPIGDAKIRIHPDEVCACVCVCICVYCVCVCVCVWVCFLVISSIGAWGTSHIRVVSASVLDSGCWRWGCCIWATLWQSSCEKPSPNVHTQFAVAPWGTVAAPKLTIFIWPKKDIALDQEINCSKLTIGILILHWSIQIYFILIKLCSSAL